MSGVDTDRLTELVEATQRWLSPAIDAFLLGRTVTLAFAPGDLTLYHLTVVPPGGEAFATPGEVCRAEGQVGVLAFWTRPAVFEINPAGTPMPEYVAEKLRTDHPPSVAAVGVLWALLVGNPVMDVVAWYLPLAGPRSPFTEWDPARIAGSPLPR